MNATTKITAVPATPASPSPKMPTVSTASAMTMMWEVAFPKKCIRSREQARKAQARQGAALTAEAELF